VTRAEQLDFPAEPRKQPFKRRLIRPAPLEIKQLKRIPQQYAACAQHSCCPEEIEHGDIQPALEAGKGDDQATRVFSRFDNEVRALVRQSLSCKK